MLRIQRSVERNHVVFALSGRIEAEDVAELRRLFRSEAEDHSFVLDLGAHRNLEGAHVLHTNGQSTHETVQAAERLGTQLGLQPR